MVAFALEMGLAGQQDTTQCGCAAGTARVCGSGVTLAFISCCPCFSLHPQHLWRAQDRPAAQENGRNRIPPGLWLCGFRHQAGCQGELCPSGTAPGGEGSLEALSHCPSLGCSIAQESCTQAETPMWAATKPTSQTLKGIILVQLIK